MSIATPEVDDEAFESTEEPITGRPAGPAKGRKTLAKNAKKPARTEPYKREQAIALTGIGDIKLEPILGCPLGSEVPRIYTPPLRELTPDTSKGFECIAFLENTLGWSLTPYQRWLYIHALEIRPGTKDVYRFNTLLVVIARQNGKTKWLQGLTLWRLFRDGAKLCLTSAQILDYAEGNLRAGVMEIKKHPNLRKDWVKYFETNGKHKLRLSDDREWRAIASNRRGGRSLSADLAVLDELREHQNFDAWNAITPTTTAIPRSLVVAVSNAGDATSVVLNGVQDKATQKIKAQQTDDTRVFLAEYSVDPDADPLDRSQWPQANPALGWLFDMEKLEGFLESQPTIEGFKTEHLCMRVESLEPGCLDFEKWRAGFNPKSKIAADSEVYWAIDVSWNRRMTYIGVVGLTAQRQLHAEILEARAGTAWVLDWCRDRMKDPTSIFEGRFAMQSRGAPGAALYEELAAVRVDPDDPDSDPLFDVVAWQGADLASSAGTMAEYIDEEMYSHLAQPVLDESIRVVQNKVSGDSWYLDRRKTVGDGAPAIAICAATWLMSQPREIARESAYADSDFVML